MMALTAADAQLAAAQQVITITRKRIAEVIALLEQAQCFEAILILKNLHDFTLGEPKP